MLNNLTYENARILIADDEAVNTELLQRSLAKAGYYDVAVVTDAARFTGVYEAVAPDLVILDLAMPGKSGYDILRELNETGREKSFVPVLVYTGQDAAESRRRAYELGASDFITRHLDDGLELLLRVRNLLGIRLLHRQLEVQNQSLEAQVQLRTDELSHANSALLLENMERQQAERALRHTEERLRFLLTSSPASVRAYKPVPPFASVYVSENVRRQTGFEAEQFLQQPSLFEDRLHPDDASRVWARLRDLSAEEALRDEYRFQKADGAWIWLREDRKVIVGEDGNPSEVVAAWIDITERKNAEEALSRQAMALATTNARLEEFDRLKSEFVATASHEMRTPLTVIREYANLLADEVPGPINGEQRECLNATLRNCDRLAGLLDKLLDIHKIEAGRLELKRSMVDLPILLEQCLADFSPKCRKRQQRLEADIEPGMPAALCDADLVSQVIVNLLGNASKFAPEDTAIGLSARLQGGRIVVEVADRGPGIAPEHLSAIFDPFRQVNRVEGPGERGTGLGLTITKRIVEMHDGTIEVESVVGEGSTFRFSIPTWTEADERRAYLCDRWNQIESRNMQGTVLRIRPKGSRWSKSTLAATLKRLDADLAPVVRSGEYPHLSLSEGDLAFVLSTNRSGALIALNRMLSRLSISDWNLNDLECSLLPLSEYESIDETVENGYGSWEVARLIHQGEKQENPIIIA